MKKLYRVVLILGTFIIVSTYSPSELNFISKKKEVFLKISKIEVVNTSLVKESEILERLGGLYNQNILTIKREDIEKPLDEVDFLEKIKVKKKYPNTIVIEVYETRPIAIIFKDKTKYLFDNSSNLISFNKAKNFENLPSIFGEGAENEFLNFFNQLKNSNFPKKKIKSYYYHKIGRWDLELFDNKIIKFPDNKIFEAIQKSIELLNRKDFENYNVIDLRIHGKIVVE